MFNWRVTKYNNIKRNLDGSYPDNEWTSYSDIDKNVTYQDYFFTEKLYIQAVLMFMKCNQIDHLMVAGLEKPINWEYDPHSKDELLRLFDKINNDLKINTAQVSHLIQLVLREKLWCKLVSPKMFVHFGWDYYMYIGSAKQCMSAIAQIQKSGLYVEQYQSPYLEDNE